MAKRRGNQEGSIYQRDNGKWQAQVSIDGRRIGKAFATRKECVEWIRQIATQKQQGLTYKGATVTTEEYLLQWLIDIEPSIQAMTYLQYRGIVLNHILPTLGRIKLSELTPRLIQDLYSSKMNAGTGKRTIEVIHAVLRRSLKFAVRYGLIGSNPTEKVQKPKHSANRMKILNEIQIQSLLTQAKRNGLLALIQLAVTTGMRKGEILGLKWRDVDWASSTIRIERQLQRIPHMGLQLAKPKTKNSIRTVKVGSVTLSVLDLELINQEVKGEKHKGDWNHEGLIFPSSKGTPKEPRNLTREFKKLLKTTSLPNVRFHDLRHTAASLMLMSNMPIMRIARQLGHAKPSTTLDIYGHLIPGLESRAVDKIDQIVVPIATQLQPPTS